MKIVHFTNWAPRRSGMYESVKDSVKYERREGHQSDMVDSYKETPKPEQIDDGWFSPIPWEQAKDADVWVMHSFIPDKLKDLFSKKICVAVLHGPNEHMMLKEFVSERKEMAFNLHINILWKYHATVAINEHEYDIMKLYDEHSRLHYIPNSIDLERVNEGEMKWEYRNHPAIVSCDVLRLEKLPMNLIWAMPKVVEKIPTARLNLFSLALEPIATWRNIFCRSKERKLEYLCESIQLENGNLKPFMRGADIGFNNNISGILSRVGMEMQALGVPVISYGGKYTPYVARIWDLDSIAEQVERVWADMQKDEKAVRDTAQQYALDNYDRAKEVKKYLALYEKLLEKKNG